MPDQRLIRLGGALARPEVDSSDYDLNPGIAPPEGRVLRPAAVLVGWVDGRSGPELVLTKRSSMLRHHPGQIAFPGGKLDPEDASPEAAALREAHEEVALNPAQVRVLGRLAPHETVTGFLVTPVLARIEGEFIARPEPGEVAEVFRVPFELVADPANYRIEKRLWQGHWRRYYVLPWGPYYIWGATARILRGLAGRLNG